MYIYIYIYIYTFGHAQLHTHTIIIIHIYLSSYHINLFLASFLQHILEHHHCNQSCVTCEILTFQAAVKKNEVV